MSLSTTIPSHIKKYFWGDDLSKLDWELHQKYIIETILDKADIVSWSWLLKQVPRDEILNNFESYRLSSKSKNFWKSYLS
ncbi:MAG: DUF6922 domain-containing protein [Patescibacteria group bacterium]